MTNSKVNVELNKYLLGLGFSAKHLGFAFLRDCIKTITKDSAAAFFLTKNVYPHIAKKYDTTIPCIERNIRNAIERAWVSGELKTIFKSCKKRPTNREAIAILSDRAILLTHESIGLTKEVLDENRVEENNNKELVS